ncbi:hypothetical protein EV426DRAFT_217073 [Tirmania nivea]|nr:hypothetical protein EV426DRAFT_217073 [Tirmania nivea]
MQSLDWRRHLTIPMALPDTTEELKAHLNAILEEPKKTQLRVRLVQIFTAQLVDVEALAPSLFPTLVPLLASVLHVVEQDPTVLTVLLQKLLQNVSFTQLLTLADHTTFLALLSSAVPPIQLLGLFLLHKAAASTGDVAIVATWNEVCKELVNTTLCANDTAVHKEANRVLLAFLLVDLPPSASGDVKTMERSGGSGLFWRRFFSDRDIYQMILQICSWNGSPGSFSEKTKAQSRLLGLIPSLAEMDWNTVTAHTFPDLVQIYTIGTTKANNLLDFATYGMVKLENDVMMGMLHLEYLSELLAATTPSDKAVTYLSQSQIGKHQEAVGLFLHPRIFTRDDMEIGLLESRAGKYCSAYAQLYPAHLADATSASIILPKDVKDHFPDFSHAEYSKIRTKFSSDGTRLVDLFLAHIAQALDTSRNPKTAYEPPITCLHLLTSLPPDVLVSPPPFSVDCGIISRQGYDKWRSSNSVVALIPLSPPVPEYISTLGALFSSSQYLYSIYTILLYNQAAGLATPLVASPDATPSMVVAASLWAKILSIAKASALADACLASISLIQAVADTPRWDGVLEILRQLQLMEFILRPPERHTARRVADPESTEFRVAMLKYNIVQSLAKVVREVGKDLGGNVREVEGVNEEKVELAKRWGNPIIQRARMGLWDAEQQPVVGTMEEE